MGGGQGTAIPGALGAASGAATCRCRLHASLLSALAQPPLSLGVFFALYSLTFSLFAQVREASIAFHHVPSPSITFHRLPFPRPFSLFAQPTFAISVMGQVAMGVRPRSFSKLRPRGPPPRRGQLALHMLLDTKLAMHALYTCYLLLLTSLLVTCCLLLVAPQTVYVFNKQAVIESYVALSHGSHALFRKLEFVGQVHACISLHPPCSSLHASWMSPPPRPLLAPSFPPSSASTT